MDKELRDLAKVAPMPQFRMDQPVITAAVFDKREDILPYKFRNRSLNSNAHWMNNQWAVAIQQGKLQ